jgi:hypothetical protein
MKFKVVDKWETKAGLTAYMVATSMGTFNGYVAVPKDNKNYKVDYMDLDVEVHGGVTFSDYELYELIEDGDWLFGFDCLHSGDGRNPKLVEKYDLKMDNFFFDIPDYPGDTWKDEKYVKEECEKLAKQLVD